jgi:hypothetical protein
MIHRQNIARKPDLNACHAFEDFQAANAKAIGPMIHQGRKNCSIKELMKI